MQRAPSYSDQRRMLQLLYLQMLMEQAQQQPDKPPQPSTLDQVVDYINKGKTAYAAGRDLYQLGTGLFNPSPAQAPKAPVPVGARVTTVDGTTPTSTTQGSFSWGEAVPYVNSALAIINAYQILKNKNLSPTQRSLALGGTAAQASVPWTGALGSAAASGFNVAGTLLGDGTEEEKTQQTAHQLGMGVANYYTGGLAGLADGFARNQWGGTMKKIDNFRFNTPGTPEWGLMQVAKLWDTDKWKTEGNRLRDLQKKGVNIPDFLQGAMQLKRGRKTKELVNPYLPKDFVGETPQYGWTNNKFATSRNEADLTGKDIWGYSAFFDKFGNDWMGKFSPQQREAIANKALGRKAVNEHHGTIDINWTPELQSEVDAITGNRTMVPKATPQAAPPAVGVTPQPGPDTTHWKGILKRIR